MLYVLCMVGDLYTTQWLFGKTFNSFHLSYTCTGTHNKHIMIYTYDYNSNSGGQWALVSTICTMDKKETKNIHL